MSVSSISVSDQKQAPACNSTESHAVKGVEELVAEFTTYDSTQGYLSCVIAILYFGTIYSLEAIGQSTLFRPWFRGVLADYAYPVRPYP